MCFYPDPTLVYVLFARVIISSRVFLHFLIATNVLDDQQSSLVDAKVPSGLKDVTDSG
jgi:hypothetical protein